MQPRLKIWLLSALAVPIMLAAQTENRIASRKAQTPELSLILEPGPVVDGVPVSFVFHLINVSQRDFRIPDPYVDCSNATPNGSFWLNESWQPPAGPGLGKGGGSCDFGGSGLRPPPITETAKHWHVLKPGDSFYLQATQSRLYFHAAKTGVYTFSAVYLPPALTESQIEALEEEDVAIPHQKATSASVQYEKR